MERTRGCDILAHLARLRDSPFLYLGLGSWGHHVVEDFHFISPKCTTHKIFFVRVSCYYLGTKRTFLGQLSYWDDDHDGTSRFETTKYTPILMPITRFGVFSVSVLFT